MSKCSHGKGVSLKLFGFAVDACTYRNVEIHRNVTVIVSRCDKCGEITYGWQRQENTESEYLDGGKRGE